MRSQALFLILLVSQVSSAMGPVPKAPVIDRIKNQEIASTDTRSIHKLPVRFRAQGTPTSFSVKSSQSPQPAPKASL